MGGGTHQSRCAHVQSVPSTPVRMRREWSCPPPKRPLTPSFPSSRYRTTPPSWPMKQASPLLANLPPSGSLSCFQLHSSIKGDTGKRRGQSTLVSESLFGKDLAATRETEAVSGAGVLRHFDRHLHARPLSSRSSSLHTSSISITPNLNITLKKTHGNISPHQKTTKVFLKGFHNISI